MGSLVPNIGMSRGVGRKNKFNISSNTHTTAEVGYLQPTFSKMLLPNSDLNLKINDFVRMSSLVVPTFGDLSLRHWCNCTPVSSLWSCLGSYLTQSQYNDLDSTTGTSVRRFMPMASMSEILGYLRCSVNSSNINMFRGNLLYLFNGTDILSWTDIVSALTSQSVSLQRKHFDDIAEFGYTNSGGVLTPKSQEDLKVKSNYYRFRIPIPMLECGIVIRNTDALVNDFKNSSGVTSFPTPSECPYVVMYINRDRTKNDSLFKNWYNSTATSGGTKDADVMMIPLTSRMYQGDTTPYLYTSGYVFKYSEASLKYVHYTGNSDGWYLRSDDSYFTGELTRDSMDICECAYYANNISSTNYDYGITWSRRFQRMRKLFIGLGYQFNPFDTQPQTMWKIYHYYKAWFDMFYPKRDTQYYQTPLSRLVNFISYHGNVCKPNMLDAYAYEVGQGTTGYTYNLLGDFFDILMACADARYVMPIDYYTLADPNPTEYEGHKNEDIESNDVTENSVIGNLLNTTSTSWSGQLKDVEGSTFGLGIVRNSDDEVASTTPAHSSIDGLTVKLATKLTTFLTKKRVIGKSVAERARAMFGSVDEHDKAHESTWCFGTTSTGINISAVMSQSETDDMHLGDYAGQGLGGSASRTFKVNAPSGSEIFIVTIMSAIVPKLAYYQGHSRENMIGISPNEFGIKMWDAIGYDDVHASEYIADVVRRGSYNLHKRSMADINGAAIGLVPRYTWYKVNPHDVLNGDMSRPSVADSLNPYVLTRDVDPNFSISPIDMRTFNADMFNKIFNESSSLDDHFIIQMHIEADMFAPLKSISNSYDTYDENEDNNIDVAHS